MVNKGRVTREHILSTAFELASRDGLDSLTIGQLAKASGMSKSGLFSHFNSKENLQVAVLEYAGDCFSQRVIQPARLAETQTIEKKLRLLLSNWLNWNKSFQGSCMFLDVWKDGRDPDDIVQINLDKTTRRWLDYLHRQLDKGIENGEFKADLDAWQGVYHLYGIYLSSHLFHSLDLETPERDRFWMGVETLLSQWRKV